MTQMKVVQLKAEDWRNVSMTLRKIADEVEAGDFGQIQVAGLVLLDERNKPYVFGAGPKAEELQIIASLSIGLHELNRMMTEPDDGD